MKLRQLTKSERKVVRRIRRELYVGIHRYDFWFVYNGDNEAISWEGGYELPENLRYRNDFFLKYAENLGVLLFQRW